MAKEGEVYITVKPGSLGPAVQAALHRAGWTGADRGFGFGACDLWLVPPKGVEGLNIPADFPANIQLTSDGPNESAMKQLLDPLNLHQPGKK